MRRRASDLNLCAEISQWDDIEAKHGADGSADSKPKLRRFTMTGYSGGLMRLFGWRHPVVVDLNGLDGTDRARPILRDHSSFEVVGHTEAIVKANGGLEVTGVISGTNDAAREIVETSLNGFPWQASIGAQARREEMVPEGEMVEVNGQTFKGPLHVVRASTLKEISFVVMGADDNTSARVAARDQRNTSQSHMDKDEAMGFEQWLKAKGFDEIDELSETQIETLKAAWQAEGSGDPAEAEPTRDVNATADDETESDTHPVQTMRAESAAETRRIAAIRTVCNGGHSEIEAKAIEEGWSKDKTELEVLRASRASGDSVSGAPSIGRGREAITPKVLEAACCLTAGVTDEHVRQDYGDQTIEAADRMRGIGLRELVATCARIEGKHVPNVFGDGSATIQAGFTTHSLPGIMENVMNKVLLSSYRAQEIVAFEVCRVGSVSDFKQVSRYRLLGTGTFEKVGADGELKHGTLGEQKFTNQADTRGQVIMLTRKDIINDDMGAFMEIPRHMGQQAAASIDDEFFTLLLSNPGGFFSAGNGNLLTGADTAFGPDALSKARSQFRKIKVGPGTKAKDKRPINISPRLLMVPVELETDADVLLGSAQLMLDGSSSSTKHPTDNPHRNKYRRLSAPHLSDSFYTGNSAAAWYLFADPAAVAAFELVFLNGRRRPVIERGEPDFDKLGMGFRGYIDFGINTQDPRGAVKSAGS